MKTLLTIALILIPSFSFADIAVMFSIKSVKIPQNAIDKVIEMGCSEPIVICDNGTRMVIDMVIPDREVAQDIKDYLTSRTLAPRLISKHNVDASKDQTADVLDSAEYLSICLTKAERHKYFGWADRVIP